MDNKVLQLGSLDGQQLRLCICFFPLLLEYVMSFNFQVAFSSWGERNNQ